MPTSKGDDEDVEMLGNKASEGLSDNVRQRGKSKKKEIQANISKSKMKNVETSTNTSTNTSNISNTATQELRMNQDEIKSMSTNPARSKPKSFVVANTNGKNGKNVKNNENNKNNKNNKTGTNGKNAKNGKNNAKSTVQIDLTSDSGSDIELNSSKSRGRVRIAEQNSNRNNSNAEDGGETNEEKDDAIKVETENNKALQVMRQQQAARSDPTVNNTRRLSNDIDINDDFAIVGHSTAGFPVTKGELRRHGYGSMASCSINFFSIIYIV